MAATLREERNALKENANPLKPGIDQNFVRGLPSNDVQGVKEQPPQTISLSENMLYWMICGSHVISMRDLDSHFSTIIENTPNVLPATPTIHRVPVPLYSPTSVEEAQQWSQTYWPTVYKKHNPRGPHPSIVSRATGSIEDRIGVYMALARQAAREASEAGIGEPVGAVIVNPSPPSDDEDEAPLPAVVVAAGDGRRSGPVFAQQEGPGNPTAHAVMRAIALVARKRHELMSSGPFASIEAQAPVDGCGNIFQDYPLIPLEHFTLSQNSLAPNGYLCTSLEIYTTHEPCVMCSMAILHSRFDKIVFAKRMALTGGMAAEQGPTDSSLQSFERLVGQPSVDKADHTTKDSNGEQIDMEKDVQGLGYGMFWRNELNWKLLGWQFVQDDEPPNISLDVHA